MHPRSGERRYPKTSRKESPVARVASSGTFYGGVGGVGHCQRGRRSRFSVAGAGTIRLVNGPGAVSASYRGFPGLLVRGADSHQDERWPLSINQTWDTLSLVDLRSGKVTQ